MSARMFFNRYPDLYDFLLEEVNFVADIIKKTPYAVTPEEGTLYPVLILLAKLHPITSVDQKEDKFQVILILMIFFRDNLNNRRMFNGAIGDLAMKPYIPHKSLLQ